MTKYNLKQIISTFLLKLKQNYLKRILIFHRWWFFRYNSSLWVNIYVWAHPKPPRCFKNTCLFLRFLCFCFIPLRTRQANSETHFWTHIKCQNDEKWLGSSSSSPHDQRSCIASGTHSNSISLHWILLFQLQEFMAIQISTRFTTNHYHTLIDTKIITIKNIKSI